MIQNAAHVSKLFHAFYFLNQNKTVKQLIFNVKHQVHKEVRMSE